MILLDGKEVKFEKFPNGETKVPRFTHNLLSPNVVFKYEDDSDLIKLGLLKSYIEQISPGTFTRLTITYMPYSRMDRIEKGSCFTLKYIANFINSLNFSSVNVLEPHSDVTCAVLNNASSDYINYNLVEKVKKEIGFNEDNDYIMFPDQGAAKRYSRMNPKNELIGNKKRSFETGNIESLEVIGDVVNPNKVIIVDDLSSYGGTFMRSGKALKELGFKEIYLLVAHAENSIFKGDLLSDESPLTKVFTTNSLITEQHNWENALPMRKVKIFDVLNGGLS